MSVYPNFEVGHIVVNSDSYVGKVVKVNQKTVKIKIIKAGKIKEENWDKNCVRFAEDYEEKDYNNDFEEVNKVYGTSPLASFEENPLGYALSEQVKSILFLKCKKEEQAIIKFIQNNVMMHRKEGEDGPHFEVEYNHPKGTFMWAVEQMKQGNKVSRKLWEGNYICRSKKTINLIIYKDKNLFMTGICDIEATDWEIFEEDITFFRGEPQGDPILELRKNGTLFIKGKLVDVDKDVVEYMRKILSETLYTNK